MKKKDFLAIVLSLGFGFGCTLGIYWVIGFLAGLR